MTIQDRLKRGWCGRSYHHGDLKAALITAARELLERDGPEKLSFRAVARAAGVSQTAPYNHFDGKDGLLATLAETGFRQLAETQRAAAEAAPPSGRVAALGRDYLRFAAANPQLYRLTFGGGVSAWSAYPQVKEAKHACFLPILEALADRTPGAGPESEDLKSAGYGLWALVHGLSMLLIAGSLDLAGAERALTAVIMGAPAGASGEGA